MIFVWILEGKACFVAVIKYFQNISKANSKRKRTFKKLNQMNRNNERQIEVIQQEENIMGRERSPELLVSKYNG